jgi:hypothetical protein
MDRDSYLGVYRTPHYAPGSEQRRPVGACAAAWNRLTVTTMAGGESCGHYSAAACSPTFREGSTDSAASPAAGRTRS